MIIAITTKDKESVTDFNSPILLIDTDKNIKEEIQYLEALKFADIFVTSHLDGFAAEDIKENGVTPVIYRGTIQNAVNDLKDCGIKRTLPYGENNSGCGGSCGI